MIESYILLSIINIWAVFKRKRILFSITKPLLMLVLMGVYIVYSPVLQILVVYALAFAWIGDMFLLSASKMVGEDIKQILIKSRYALASGVVAFIICHLFYIWTFFRLSIPDNNLIIYILIMLVYIIIGDLFYLTYVRDFAELDSASKVGIGIYVFVILLMSFSSLLIINITKIYTILPFMGSLLFILSDYLLAIGYKRNNSINHQPWVMASYLTAQFLIIAGLILREYNLNFFIG